MVIPGESACHECLERGARREFPLYEELSRTGARRSIPPAATLGAASGLVGSMLAMEAIHFLTGAATPATLSRAIVVDLRSMRTTEEDIARDPSCPACGSACVD
jgi:bacteriocin biosynthesis cyclodehydratase domain-containing protein